MPTALRVRLRALYHGRVTVEGGSISDNSDFPALRVGQHVITSAHFNADFGEWVPFGVFEVRDGRVVALDTRLHTTTRWTSSRWRSANPPADRPSGDVIRQRHRQTARPHTAPPAGIKKGTSRLFPL
jgi:hypothetical protein